MFLQIPVFLRFQQIQEILLLLMFQQILMFQQNPMFQQNRLHRSFH
jgi:hypothetical protein